MALFGRVLFFLVLGGAPHGGAAARNNIEGYGTMDAETTDITGLKCCQLTHGGAGGGWAQYCRTYQGECRQPYAQPIARALCEQKKTGPDGSESYVVKEECP
mmetsp:Transcript_97783/g.304920  ORF Transcript_97783/g.304920 Transcript_97783/m.304920 type:complete len:102 (-) Transcript_97783:91-396(-)